MNTKFVLRRSVVVLAIAFALGSSRELQYRYRKAEWLERSRQRSGFSARELSVAGFGRTKARTRDPLIKSHTFHISE